eukprot:6188454-Pleurochrysis_carterae.AAC.4
MARRHARHRRRGQDKERAEQRELEAAHPLADPRTPVPNLIAADRFEAYYIRQQLVQTHQEWRQLITTLHRYALLLNNWPWLQQSCASTSLQSSSDHALISEESHFDPSTVTPQGRTCSRSMPS